MTTPQSPADRRTRVLVGLLLAAAALAGCATGAASAAAPSQPAWTADQPLAIIMPVHQNAQAPGIPAELDSILDAAIRAGAPISLVTAEGRPSVLLQGFVAHVATDNDLAAEDDVVAAKNAIIAAAANAAASSDGNDLLAAISLAADLAPGGVIVSLDNGATDTGAVRTADDGMTTLVDPADVAQLVLDAGACPAVEGARIELYSLGYQVAPAQPVSQRQRDRVAQTWKSSLEACGAQVDLVALPRTGAGPVNQHTARAIAPEPDPTLTVSVATPCETVLPDSVIGFVANQATLLAADAARATIATAAESLSACTGRVEVVGTTSSAGTEQGRAALSTARAQAVRTLLAEALGVPEDSIGAVGLGYDTEKGGCVVDRADGVLDPMLAAANRKVTIRIVPAA